MQRSLPHLLVDLSDRGSSAELVDAVLDSIGDGSSRFGGVRIALSQAAAEHAHERLQPDWKLETGPRVIEAANLSLLAAAREGADLLVLDGTTVPDASSLQALLRVLERDPYLAFAQPRIASFGTQLIERLDPERGDPEVASIPRSVIDSSPELLLIPDRLGASVLLRADVVRDFAPLDESFETLRGALRELIARARRVGFRCVIANRALASAPRRIEAGAEARRRDMNRVQRDFPELVELERLWAEHPIHEYESKLGRAASFSAELRQTLLVDLTDMGPIRNGTSESILGILSGIHEAAAEWRTTLLVSPENAAYHALGERFPEFRIEWPDPVRSYTAAFRPIQPWSIASQIRLHRLAAFNFCLMHDTISEDIFLDAPPRLTEAWSFLARNADGLIFNSDFTRQRFKLRFPMAPCVDEYVCLHSLDPDDYVGRARSDGPGEHIYVVGNTYPHKWMRQTIVDLATAFPYKQIKALGYQDSSIPQLEGLPSGQISDEVVESLYADASIIVYPSQYEGFGLPIVRGLSYGRDVIARKSDLLREIAENYRGPGRLFEFDSRESLIEGVGRLLNQLEVEGLPLGGTLAPEQPPRSWKEVGADILEFIENRVQKPEASNWEQRQERVSNMEAYEAIQRLWAE